MIESVTVSFLIILSTFFSPTAYATGFQHKHSDTITSQIITISDARKQAVGNQVTVAGRVTVSDQFGGPAFIQDTSAGIAIYDSSNNLYPQISIGDSLVVTGQLSQFHSLLELTNISYTVYPETNIVKPKEITLNQISEAYEGQLVAIKNASYSSKGTFSIDKNYPVSDAFGSAIVRIDNNTDINGSQIPTTPVNITGVVSEYDHTYQIMPRNMEDAGAVPFPVAGSDVPLKETFDIATWNLEWFGNASHGPANDSLQIANVASVLKKIDADLYAVEEVSNSIAFQKLLSLLPGYHGFEAHYSQTQKTAFIYKAATIDSISSQLIEPAGYSNWDYYWANGRPPFEFTFNATINGITKQIHAFDIHAKAMSDQTSYDRRINASKEFKTYLDNNLKTQNLIIMGDYNDDVDQSIFNNDPSPYNNFVADSSYYRVITRLLSKRNEASTTAYSDMIDHITVSNELYPVFYTNTQQVVKPEYIVDYSTTTSDHYPVFARFRFDHTLAIQHTNQPRIPQQPYLSQNYPNPFNPSTNIQFNLPVKESVTLEVYNILGQKVASLINHKPLPAGQHMVTFHAGDLPSGIYFYRLDLGSGQSFTKKMTLMK